MAMPDCLFYSMGILLYRIGGVRRGHLGAVLFDKTFKFFKLHFTHIGDCDKMEEMFIIGRNE